MVHRTMGLPHKSEPKNSYCVIWDKAKKNISIYKIFSQGKMLRN